MSSSATGSRSFRRPNLPQPAEDAIHRDTYCYDCHQDASADGTWINCVQCWRIYHQSCLRLESDVDQIRPVDDQIRSNVDDATADFKCSICTAIHSEVDGQFNYTKNSEELFMESIIFIWDYWMLHRVKHLKLAPDGN